MPAPEDPRVLRVELRADVPLLNPNDHRYRHWGPRAAKTKVLREATAEALQGMIYEPFTTKVRIRCIYRARNNQRRDSSNMYWSFKACVDELVAKGVLPADDDRYVAEFAIVRGENYPGHTQLIVQVISDG